MHGSSSHWNVDSHWILESQIIAGNGGGDISMTNELEHSIDGSANTLNCEWMWKKSTTKNQDVALFYWAIGLFRCLPYAMHAKSIK